MEDRQVVTFINAAYGTKLPLDGKVVHVTNESDSDGKRFMDWLYQVNDQEFHMEVQSSEDGSMALRMVEYGFRSALLHGKIMEGNKLKMKFPNPLVFYIRGGLNTPTELTTEFELPPVNLTLYLPIRTLRMIDYTFRQLADEKLIPLLEFYPLKYWSVFGSGNERDAFLDEIKEVPKILEDLLDSGWIDEEQKHDILLTFKNIAQQTIQRTKITTLKGDIQAMAAIEDMDSIIVTNIWTTIDRYKKEGETIGEKKANLNAVQVALQGGASLDFAQKMATALGVSKTEFDKIYAAVAKESAADVPVPTT
jgi:hypothetical protein